MANRSTQYMTSFPGNYGGNNGFLRTANSQSNAVSAQNLPPNQNAQINLASSSAASQEVVRLSQPSAISPVQPSQSVINQSVSNQIVPNQPVPNPNQSSVVSNLQAIDNSQREDGKDDIVRVKTFKKKKGKIVKENIVLPDEPEQKIIFADLSFHDLEINLRVLSNLKKDEQIMIYKNIHMKVDDRWLKSLRRKPIFSDDSREKTLEFVGHVIFWSERIFDEVADNIKYDRGEKNDNITKLCSIRALLDGSMTGLRNLTLTYNNDNHCNSTIVAYESRIKNMCNKDMGKIILAT